MNSSLSIGLSYGSFTFFFSILHNIFLLYHVETFVSIYRISQSGFWLAEAVFLIWNSMNDQIFGWFSDCDYLTDKPTKTGQAIVLDRVVRVQRTGPLLALAFMLFWFPILHPTLQFLLALCLYDSALTIVDLQQSALLADLTVSSKSRVNLGTYSAVFNGLGSMSVFASYIFWDKTNPARFQTFCLALSVVSAVGFHYSGRNLIGHFSTNKTTKSQSRMKTSSLSPYAAMRKYACQVSKHKNFLYFSAMNLIQVFNCHLNSNFFPLFLDVLLSRRLSPTLASFLMGVSFLAPHLNNVYLMHLCHRLGTYKVVRILFAVKIALCLCLLRYGHDQFALLCFFIASNRIFTEGICKLLNLVITDLVDEDTVLHQRPQAVSALIFGTSSLLSKPGQTLAPLIGTWIIALHTGKNHFSFDANIDGALNKEACFLLVVWVPMICTAVQMALWSCFTLHGQRLETVKRLRSANFGPYLQNV